MIAGRFWWIVATMVLSSGAWPAEQAGYPERPGVRVERAGGITRLDAVFPGVLLDLALRDVGDGRREGILLVFTPHRPPASDSTTQADGPEDEGDADPLPPCPEDEHGTGETGVRLYRLDLDGRDEPTLLRADLPVDCSSIHPMDIDEDGRDELLLGCRDGLYRISLGDERTEPKPILQEPDSVWRFLAAGPTPSSGTGETVLVGNVRLGALTLYRPSPPVTTWTSVATIELPMEGDVRPGGLWIRSPTPRFLGRDGSGALVFVTEPESIGPRRLRTLLIEASLPGEVRATECWSRLPAPEDLLESEILRLDGQPVLFVTTKPEGKLNFFGEKFLRLYSLGQRDRSRLGSSPLFETESRMNLWQEAVPGILDVNDDGLEDLVLGYWKGILDDTVVLDVYLREPEGSFRTSPRTTALDIKDGDRAFVVYGTDIDGDGLPDLLVKGAEGLLLYPGRPSPNGKRVVAGPPRTIPMDDLGGAPGYTEVVLSSEGLDPRFVGSLSSRPRLVDLNGDDRPEILMSRRGSATRPAAIRVIRLESD